NLATVRRCEALNATKVPPLVPPILVLNVTGSQVFFANQAYNLLISQNGYRIVQNAIVTHWQTHTHDHSSGIFTEQLQHFPATLQGSAHHQSVAE
ncbi:MAG: hypothetical protein ACJARS_003366, partial [bacterium]